MFGRVEAAARDLDKARLVSAGVGCSGSACSSQAPEGSYGKVYILRALGVESLGVL